MGESSQRSRLTNVENFELGRVKGQKQVCGADLKSLREKHDSFSFLNSMEDTCIIIPHFDRPVKEK